MAKYAGWLALCVTCSLMLDARCVALTFSVTHETDADDGICDEDCSLREAVTAANTSPGGDEVTLPAGEYVLSLGPLAIGDDLELNGAGSPTTVVDGDDASRVIEVATDATVRLRGLTIRGGRAENGGGILNQGTLEIRETRVTGNAARGTVVGACQMLPVPIGCFQMGGMGGGIYNEGELLVRDSTVDGNTAFNDNNSCPSGPQGPILGTFVPCLPLQQGAGIASSGVLRLENSTVSGNQSGDDFESSELLPINGSGCGGILSTGELTLANATVTGNYAYRGGGLCSSGAVAFRNTIMALDAAASYESDGECVLSGNVEADAYNLEYSLAESQGFEVQPSCGFSGSDLLGADPLLGPLDDNGGPTPTHALSLGSAAVNAGSPAAPGSGGAACSAVDQRGVERPQGPRCDIGAYERAPVDCPGDCDGDGVVGVDEILRSVRISLALLPLSDCVDIDLDDSGGVSISELIQVVRRALLGC